MAATFIDDLFGLKHVTVRGRRGKSNFVYLLLGLMSVVGSAVR